jgi:hypothetical protein
MGGSYYGRARAPAASTPAFPVGSVLAALFLTNLLAGVANVIIGALTGTVLSSDGGAMTRAVLVSYLVQFVVALLVGAVLLPSFLAAFADLRIGGAAAAVAIGGGVLAADALRYGVVQLAFQGARRYAVPSPAALSGGLLLTWLTSIAGIAVSLHLVRRYAVAAGVSPSLAYRASPGSATGGLGPVVLLVFVPVAVAALITVSVRPRAQAVPQLVPRATAGESATAYAAKLGSAQGLVFDVFNTVATEPAKQMPILLRLDYDTLDAQIRLLAITRAPTATAARVQKRLVRGLSLFARTLPRVANLPTTTAQEHALFEAPGLREIHLAFRRLNVLLARLNVAAPSFRYDEAQWSRILRR